MRRLRRISMRAAVVAGGTTIVLLLIIAGLLPWLAGMDVTRDRIIHGISSQIGGKADFKELELSYFPVPHVQVRQVSFNVPGKLTGSVESITAYPRILPLLLGKGHLAKLSLSSPVLSVSIPDSFQRETPPHGEDPSGESPPQALAQETPGGIEQKLASVLEPLIAKAPGLTILVDNGRLELAGSVGVLFWLRSINGRIDMPAGNLGLNFGCESNLWSSLSVSGWVRPWDLSGKGRVYLTEFKPDALSSYFHALTPGWLGSARLSLSMDIESNGPKDIKAELNGSIPSLVLLGGGGEEFTVRADELGARCTIQDSVFSVELSKMVLGYPRLSLNGKFTMDKAGPVASLDLESRDTDADGVRKVTLGIAGGHKNVRRIFDIIRGGHVPWITYSATAASPALFGKAENYVIRGSMEHGKIFVPNVELDVEDASGEVVIAHGILDGHGLSGRTLGSYGKEGILKIGLVTREGTEKPFHLDIDIDADLSELQPVLQRVVKHDLFLRELALVEDAKGRAQGRLLLGETLSEVKTKVEVRSFNLEGSYKRLPHPAEVSGGPFLYDPPSIFFHSAKGRMGKSTFSEIDTTINWSGQSMLQILSVNAVRSPGTSASGPAAPAKEKGASGAARPKGAQGNGETVRARISLDEIYPWVLSLDTSGKFERNIASAKGALLLDSVSVTGPWRMPRDLQIHANGALEDSQLKWAFIPAPLSIKAGRFDATPDRLELDGLQLAFWDASCTLSGAIDGYIDKLGHRDLQIQGALGPQAHEWFTEILRIPPSLRPRAPVTIARSHLVMEKDKSVSYTADMSVKNGPDFSVDVEWSYGSLAVKGLRLMDDESNATLSFGVKGKELALNFDGSLSSGTVDRLLEKNQLLSGSIKGSFQSLIIMDRPMSSTAKGELKVTGFRFNSNDSPPVLVDSALLAADGSKLTIHSARVSWKGSPLDLGGTVGFSAEGFNLDMRAEADSFTWGNGEQGDKSGSKNAKPAEKDKEKEKSTEIRPALFGLPLRGKMDVKFQSFTHDKLTWNPLNATVSFLPEGVSIEAMEARLCNIPTPGALKITQEGVQLHVQVATANQEVEPTLACFWKKKELMNGTFKLYGELGTPEPVQEGLTRALQGKVELKAEKGRIYRLGLISKIFAMLNLTEIYRGQLPDLVDEGFAYDTITSRGVIKDGKLLIDDSVIDGPFLKMAFHGEVDLAEKKMNMTVLVAPLKTVDTLVGNIPLLGKLLGGGLISIPVKVEGELADPDIYPLAPSAVGSELLGALKRTLKFPFTLFE